MNESRVEIDEAQSRIFVYELRGEVFHVTMAKNLPSIKNLGGILVNFDGDLETTFGYSSNSYFRMNGCVSVFDYESCSNEKWQEHMWKCNPLKRCDDGELAFIFLSDECRQELIRWPQLKDNWIGTQVVPHVEAGHVGTIGLEKIREIIIVKVKIDPNSLAAKLKNAMENANKTNAVGRG